MRVEPAVSVVGHVAVPGDKSISHRAVMLAAIGEGETRVRGFGRGGDTEATVHNTFKRAGGGKPVGFDYSMRKTADGWKIYDIVVEGVSLVLTYRSEFDAVVKQDGIDGLIKRLAEKNAPAPAGGAAK